MKLTARQLLTRVGVFLSVFVVFSGIIGPRIVSHGLVEHDGFQIYGGAGKALLFGVLVLLLLTYRKDEKLQLNGWHPKQIIWLVLSVMALAVAWLGVDRLIAGHTAITWVLLTHAGIIVSVILAAGGTIGPRNLRALGKVYKKEILLSLTLAVLFYAFLYLVYGLWRVLATVALHSVSWLLGVIGIHSTILPPRTLLLSKFGINIAQYCSGIESIALFSALYGLIGVLDWRHFNHRKFLWIFLPALIVLFIFNILRVFVLILGGYYINPQIAFSLFHTYAGMVFFIVYSAVFWASCYKYMLVASKSDQ
jgi:exosortase/archaeosortase family protein